MTFIYTPPDPSIQAGEELGDFSLKENHYTESQLRSEVERVRRETIEEIMTDWADHMKRMVKAIK